MNTSLASRAVGAAIAALLAVLGSLFVPAMASAAPGDNGVVKIHNAGTPADDEHNEPQVCVFYLVAFHFDGLQQVTWHINQQPPTGTSQVSQGTITLDDNGHGYTTDMTLPDGHYKLYWNWEGQTGAGKSKVFTVDCTNPSPSHSVSPSASPSSSASTSPSASASASPSASGSASPSQPAPLSPTASAGNGGSGPTLPITGVPLWMLVGIAGLSVTIGVLLRIRLRRQH
ncbi:MAG TPA: hypothetical protein VGN37_08110 [Actinocatenispora sp.]